MTTLVIYDATDIVQVGAAAILKSGGAVTYASPYTSTDVFDRVINLFDTVDTEVQALIAATNLGYVAPAPGAIADPTVHSDTQVGKAGMGWDVDEHKGKWVQLVTGATTDLVLIAGNDATTLTFSTTLTNTTDATSTFQIIDAEDINLTWLSENPIKTAWEAHTDKDYAYPMLVLSNQHLLYDGAATYTDPTHFGVAGFAIDALIGTFVTVNYVTALRTFVRKITDNTALAITVDAAVPVPAGGETHTAKIYVSQEQILLEQYLRHYFSTYMSDLNHPYWVRLFDNEGALAKGGPATYDEALFAEILADGKKIFDGKLIENGGSFGDIMY